MPFATATATCSASSGKSWGIALLCNRRYCSQHTINASMWRTMGTEDAASRVSFDSKSRVVLPVDPRCYIGCRTAGFTLRLRLRASRGPRSHRHSRQLEPVLGPALAAPRPAPMYFLAGTRAGYTQSLLATYGDTTSFLIRTGVRCSEIPCNLISTHPSLYASSIVRPPPNA